jgi:Leucine-rich repeat (LRR) protein
MQRLETLDMSKNVLRSVSGLSCLRALRTLILDSNPITNLHPDSFGMHLLHLFT